MIKMAFTTAQTPFAGKPIRLLIESPGFIRLTWNPPMPQRLKDKSAHVSGLPPQAGDSVGRTGNTPEPAVRPPPGWVSVLICLLLALVTMALYWPVTGYDFVNFDDGIYVYHNAHVQSGVNWQSSQWAFTNLDVGLWHPLTWMSHMLDCQWFGLRSGWHHLTSLLLHAANTVLLFVVLRRMTGALWRSALVAALFALHPLHVESVAWVAERKDVLSTFFVMLTLWTYHRYTQRRSPKADLRSPVAICHLPAAIFYLLSVFFFVCGLMSKPMVVTLPAVLLLLDYWPLKRFDLAAFVARPRLAVRLLLEKLPFVLAALLTGLITLRAANRVGSLPSVAHCPIPDRLANATLSYAGYFRQVFWPGNLAVYYPLPATFSVWSVAGAALLLLGISVTAFCLARRRPYVVVGWLWYLVTLLPVIGLIQLAGYSHADRYTYVSLIGVFVLLVWGVHDLSQRWRYGVLAMSVAGSAAIVLCLGLTQQQLGHWKNSVSLWTHTLACTSGNSEAHYYLGVAWSKQGKWKEAMPQFERVLQLKPDDAEAHHNLGIALAAQGKLDEAIAHYAQALQLKPDYAEAHSDLAVALAAQEKWQEAIAQFERALQLKPDYADAAGNLAWLLATCREARFRNPAEALRRAQRARELTQSRVPEVLDTLAAAQAAGGDFARAAETAKQALALARGAGNELLAREIQSRLDLYQAGQPFYEPPPGP